MIDYALKRRNPKTRSEVFFLVLTNRFELNDLQGLNCLSYLCGTVSVFILNLHGIVSADFKNKQSVLSSGSSASQDNNYTSILYAVFYKNRPAEIINTEKQLFGFDCEQKQQFITCIL